MNNGKSIISFYAELIRRENERYQLTPWQRSHIFYPGIQGDEGWNWDILSVFSNESIDAPIDLWTTKFKVIMNIFNPPWKETPKGRYVSFAWR